VLLDSQDTVYEVHDSCDPLPMIWRQRPLFLSLFSFLHSRHLPVIFPPLFACIPRGFDWLLMTVMPACIFLALYDLYVSDNRRQPFCSIPHCLLPCITSFSCPQSYRFASLSTAVSPLAFICFSLLTSTQNLFVRIRRAFTSLIAYLFAHRILLILLNSRA
jgi:hypothetical protein